MKRIVLFLTIEGALLVLLGIINKVLVLHGDMVRIAPLAAFAIGTIALLVLSGDN